METITDAQNQLELYLLEVEDKYLKSHLGSIESPNDYMFDVKSYCILCHAAFEEYMENICIVLLQEVWENFIFHQRYSYSTLCLLHFKGDAEDIDDENWGDNQRMFDYIKEKLKTIKNTYSIYLMSNNHGVSMKYLKKMLIPLGLDIPLNPIWQNSLTQLAKFRGGYAHTSKRVATTLSPEDANKYVYDVYDMMIDITSKARHIHYYSIH